MSSSTLPSLSACSKSEDNLSMQSDRLAPWAVSGRGAGIASKDLKKMWEDTSGNDAVDGKELNHSGSSEAPE